MIFRFFRLFTLTDLLGEVAADGDVEELFWSDLPKDKTVEKPRPPPFSGVLDEFEDYEMIFYLFFRFLRHFLIFYGDFMLLFMPFYGEYPYEEFELFINFSLERGDFL